MHTALAGEWQNKFMNSENSLVAKSRGYLYRLMAMLYLREAAPETLNTLKSREVTDALEDLGVYFGDALRGTPDEVLLNALAEEYAALFIVSGGIPPYESVRLTGLLFQEPASEVERFYKRCGLEMNDDLKLFPDHIGMEFEFMGYLAGRESEAWDDGDEDSAVQWSGLQKEFFSRHIDKWVFGFLDDLERLAFHPFYKDLAVLTRRFIEEDRRELLEREDIMFS